jgi:hypothetical protein
MLIKAASSEIAGALELIEQVLPGVNLDAVKKQIAGLEVTSDTKLGKTLPGGLKATLEIQIVEG